MRICAGEACLAFLLRGLRDFPRFACFAYRRACFRVGASLALRAGCRLVLRSEVARRTQPALSMWPQRLDAPDGECAGLTEGTTSFQSIEKLWYSMWAPIKTSVQALRAAPLGTSDAAGATVGVDVGAHMAQFTALHARLTRKRARNAAVTRSSAS